MHGVPLHFRLAHLFVTWLFLLLYIGPAFAQSTLSASPDADVSDVDAQVFPDTPTIPTTIAVGVYESPPFVIIDKEARVRGLAIDIWERIADERGWAFDYHHYTRDELLDATTQGEADVVVGAIGATGALAESVDLSHPMLSTGLGVAVREDPNTLKTRLTRATQHPTLWLSGVGFLVLLFLGLRMDRLRQKSAPRYAWLSASMAALLTFSTALGMMIARGPTAHPIQTAEDLKRHAVVSVTNSTAETWLSAQAIPHHTVGTLPQALTTLRQGHADAVLYERPALAWHTAQTEADGLRVLPLLVDRKDYTFILPEHSPLRTPINTSMLDAIDSSDWTQYLDRYALSP